MNETLQTLKNRRSVRSYLPEHIKDEELQQILEAGIYAPTGMGAQSPIIVVVQDKQTIAYLSKLNAAVMGSTSDPFYGAPTVVVVLADRSRGTCVEDGSLVIGNMLNAAASLGVGSCWIHRAKEVFDTPEGKALLEKWGIQGDYVGVGNCILGYAKGEIPAAKPRKENYLYRVGSKSGNTKEKEPWRERQAVIPAVTMYTMKKVNVIAVISIWIRTRCTGF